MKMTQNLNIGGFSFAVEQDAASSLEEYLGAMAAACSSDCNSKEILEDIESRIAELLTEVRGGSEVITAEMVSYVKMRIGDPALLRAVEEGDIPEGSAAAAANTEGSAATADDSTDEKSTSGGGAKSGNVSGSTDSGKSVNNGNETSSDTSETSTKKKHSLKGKRLYRDIEGKNIGGVCSGLAWYFNVDVALVRIIWTTLLIGGLFIWDGNLSVLSVALYLVACLCIPVARTVAQKNEMRGEKEDLTRYASFTVDPSASTPTTHRKSTLLRIICIGFGLLLLCCGLGCIMGSIVLPIAPSFLKLDIFTELQSEMADILPGGMNLDALLSPAFWWILFAFLMLLGLGFCYGALMLIFDFNAPRWHPGLIILLLWVVSLVALVIYVLKFAVEAAAITFV